jgi:hypothetical protein
MEDNSAEKLTLMYVFVLSDNSIYNVLLVFGL